MTRSRLCQTLMALALAGALAAQQQQPPPLPPNIVLPPGFAPRLSEPVKPPEAQPAKPEAPKPAMVTQTASGDFVLTLENASLVDVIDILARRLKINYILDPTVIAIISNVRYYANPNKDSFPFLNKDVSEDPGIYPPEDVYKKLEILKPATPEELEKYQKVWLDVVG